MDSILCLRASSAGESIVHGSPSAGRAMVTPLSLKYRAMSPFFLFQVGAHRYGPEGLTGGFDVAQQQDAGVHGGFKHVRSHVEQLHGLGARNKIISQFLAIGGTHPFVGGDKTNVSAFFQQLQRSFIEQTINVPRPGEALKLACLIQTSQPPAVLLQLHVRRIADYHVKAVRDAEHILAIKPVRFCGSGS